ncbi:unnamed protein product [Brassica oleracea var. botrytis]|uniref:Uncharacterized protein n=3 Tax=Brassica TaxID=3705 RepID=A0A0D3ACC9_BRAOL|nr:unnamed protein product [Brassica napus]CDY72566.1 BnaAnng41490D [Brassica napus]VDD52061.1 unnamed protein product [Brassica oleracea]
MPKNEEDCPTLDDMISQNQRWKWRDEAGVCTNRPESAAMGDKSRSLVLVNYFPDTTDLIGSCKQNYAPLPDTIKKCQEASGKR